MLMRPTLSAPAHRHSVANVAGNQCWLHGVPMQRMPRSTPCRSAAAPGVIGQLDPPQPASLQHGAAHAQSLPMSAAPDAARQLTRELKATTTWQELQQVWDVHAASGMLPNHLNIAAAMTHLAQLAVPKPWSTSKQRDVFALSLLQAAVQPEQISAMQPRQLSNLLWACMRLELVRSAAAAPHWTVLLEAFSSAISSHAPGVTLGPVHRRRHTQAANCNISDLSIAAYACASARSHPGKQWLLAVESTSEWLLLQQHQSRQRGRQLSCQEVANLAYALASLHHHPAPGWLTAFMTASLPLLERMGTQELAVTAWAVPQLVAGQHVSAAAGEQELAQQLTQYVQRLCQVMSAQVHRMGLEQVSAALWGMSVGTLPVGTLSPEWTQSIFADVEQKLSVVLGGDQDNHYSGSQPSAPSGAHGWSLSNLLTAAARIDHRPPDTFLHACIAAVASQHMPRQQRPGLVSRPSAHACEDIAAVLSACAHMAYAPPPELMNRLLIICRVASQQSASISEQAALLWALAKLRYVPDDAWLRSYQASMLRPLAKLQQAPEASEAEVDALVKMLWALGQLRQPPISKRSAPTAQAQVPDTQTAAGAASEPVAEQENPTHTASGAPPRLKVVDADMQQGRTPRPQPATQRIESEWQRAALAALQPHMNLLRPKHIVQLVWSLSMFVRTTGSAPSLEFRRGLAAVLQQHIHTLTAPQLAACVGALPGMAFARHCDQCGLLRKLLSCGVRRLPEMTPAQASQYVSGMHGMGYLLSTGRLSQLSHALGSQPWPTFPCKVTVQMLVSLAGLGLGSLPQRSASLQHSKPEADEAVAQLQAGLLARLQHHSIRLDLNQVTAVVDALSQLGWNTSNRTWRGLYHSARLQIQSGSGRQVAHLLFALARYEAMHATVRQAEEAVLGVKQHGQGQAQTQTQQFKVQALSAVPDAAAEPANKSASLPSNRHMPSKLWMEKALARISADLTSLSPRDVAELIVALVRLRHDAADEWLTDLLTRMEARSALFNKADHAQLRAAWAQLGTAQHRGGRVGPRARGHQGRSRGGTQQRDVGAGVEQVLVPSEALVQSSAGS